MVQLVGGVKFGACNSWKPTSGADPRSLSRVEDAVLSPPSGLVTVPGCLHLPVEHKNSNAASTPFDNHRSSTTHLNRRATSSEEHLYIANDSMLIQRRQYGSTITHDMVFWLVVAPSGPFPLLLMLCRFAPSRS